MCAASVSVATAAIPASPKTRPSETSSHLATAAKATAPAAVARITSSSVISHLLCIAYLLYDIARVLCQVEVSAPCRATPLRGSGRRRLPRAARGAARAPHRRGLPARPHRRRDVAPPAGRG